MWNIIRLWDLSFQLRISSEEYSSGRVVSLQPCNTRMFAIAFDMDIKELRNTYGEPYNNAYYEIKILLRKYDFYNTQGSVYLTDKDDMANLFAAIYALKKIDWFKTSVRDIRAFKVENWSDFTQIVKEN